MMTQKERLTRVLERRKTDRIPVYTQIPFEIKNNQFVPGPFHGYKDYDDWRAKDPRYCRIVERMESECDNFFIWRPDCMLLYACI